MKHIPFIFLLLIPFCAISQKNDSLPNNLKFIKNTNVWLSSNNYANLHHFNHSHLSTAKVSMQKQNGKFVNYYKSDNSLNINAETESYFRLNNKIVLYGLVNYQNFNGKNMGGSVFINPYKNPFNIIEGTDTTQGNKSMEQYKFLGAFSIEFIKNLYWGTKFDYHTAHYAKHRDLRHQNKLLNLNLTSGISYNFKYIEIGVNYEYNRRIEEVLLKSFGNTDKQYVHLIDFGNFFGRNELFDDQHEGYISGYSFKPILSETHGVDCQIGITINDKWTLFNQLTLQKIKGYFGTDDSYSRMFSRHNGKTLIYTGILQLSTNNNIHQINVTLTNSNLKNKERIHRFSTEQGKLTKIEYLGDIDVFDKTVKTAKVNYTTYLGVNNSNPKWTIQAGLSLKQRTQKTTLFPFYRTQDLNKWLADVSLGKTFFFNKTYLSVTLAGAYGTGSGNPFTDDLRSSSFDPKQKPITSDFNLYREYEYFTAKRIISSININYSFPIRDNILAYIEGAYSLHKGFDLQYLNNDKLHQIDFTLGVRF